MSFRARSWKRLGLLLVALGLLASLPLQAAELVRFQFERIGVEVPAYTIVLNADGTGTYSEDKAPVRTAGSAAEADKAGHSSAIRVSPSVLRKLLEDKASIGEKSCETRLKHIANTGQKTLTYSGNGTPVSCTFNYSDKPSLNQTASTFIAMAETLQAGERLAAKHRFDRLGLDLEMQSLVEEVRSGRAIEVANIGPVLRSIAEDDRVIDRVRRSAARLLQDGEAAWAAPPEMAAPDGSSPR